MTHDFRADRVGSALAGTNPTILRRLPSGYAAIGDQQHLPGYCVLLTDTPGIDQLTDLDAERQVAFLADAALLARAVSTVCRRRDPRLRRINLEVQGNTDGFLHAHVTPRYEWEPADLVGWPAALHYWTDRVSPEHALGPKHDDLRADLAAAIDAELDLRAGSSR